MMGETGFTYGPTLEQVNNLTAEIKLLRDVIQNLEAQQIKAGKVLEGLNNENRILRAALKEVL